MHFRYTDLESNAVAESLILFPGDASFIKVSERPGTGVKAYTMEAD